jgi:diguanylate cyclase (GGDEF)-like protein
MKGRAAMNPIHNYRLKYFPAALCLWLVLAVFLVNFIGTINTLLAISLLVFATIISITRLFKLSSITAAIVSIGLFGTVEYYTQGWMPKAIVTVCIFGLFTVLTVILAAYTGKVLDTASRQLFQDQEMINDLGLFDPSTKLLKLTYAKQRLNTEVLRSQRYKRDLCVMVVEPGYLDPVDSRNGKVDREKTLKTLANMISASMRAVDIVFKGDKIGIVLPETHPEGSRVVGERLIGQAENEQISLFIGVSHFPSDAVTVDDLLKAANAALQIAVTSHQPLAYYSQIRMAVENIKPEAGTIPANNSSGHGDKNAATP